VVLLDKFAVDKRGELRLLVRLHEEAASVAKHLRFDQHDLWNVESLKREWHASCLRAA
jgi:hypothetical protein